MITDWQTHRHTRTQTDRQTDALITILPAPYRGRSKKTLNRPYRRMYLCRVVKIRLRRNVSDLALNSVSDASIILVNRDQRHFFKSLVNSYLCRRHHRCRCCRLRLSLSSEYHRAQFSDRSSFYCILRTCWSWSRGITCTHMRMRTTRTSMASVYLQMPRSFRCRCLRASMKSHCGCRAIVYSSHRQDGDPLVRHESKTTSDTPDTNPDRRGLHYSRCFRSWSGDLHRLRRLHEVACFQDCVYLFRSLATDP